MFDLDYGDALTAITICWGIGALFSWMIAIPQTHLLFKVGLLRDPYWRYRLMSVSLFGALGLALSRNWIVWLDYTFFEQAYLGTIQQRWRLDLTMALVVMVACIYAALLYIGTRIEEAGSRRGQVEEPALPACAGCMAEKGC